MPVMDARPLTLLLLIGLGGCMATEAGPRPVPMQPMTIAAQPAAAPLTTGSIKTYRQHVETFDGALTGEERHAVMVELRKDIARNKAAAGNR